MSINTIGDIPCCGNVHYFGPPSTPGAWQLCTCAQRAGRTVDDMFRMVDTTRDPEAIVVAAREPGQVGAQARAELATIAALTLPGPGGLTALAAEFGFDSLRSERCTGSRASALGAWRGGQRKQITVTDEWLCRTPDARRVACRMLAAEFATWSHVSDLRERLHMPALPPRTECVSWDGSIWQRPAHAGEPWSRLSTGRVVVEPDAIGPGRRQCPKCLADLTSLTSWLHSIMLSSGATTFVTCTKEECMEWALRVQRDAAAAIPVAKAPTPEQQPAIRSRLDEIRRSPHQPIVIDADPALPRPDGFAQSQVDAAKAVLLANVPKRGAK